MPIPQHLVSGWAVQRKLACRYFDRSFLPALVVFHLPVGFHQSLGACRT